MPPARRPALPDGFVHLDAAVPDLALDLRYATAGNFVGRRIDGYRGAHAVLSAPAAAALARVQAALRPFGLGLKVFDAYRPQRAVDHFVRWGGDLDDQRTKPRYYPDVAKEDLFREGYLARRSSHSRGAPSISPSPAATAAARSARSTWGRGSTSSARCRGRAASRSRPGSGPTERCSRAS